MSWFTISSARALACGRKILLHVNLPKRFPKPAIGGRYASLPSGQQFLRALQNAALEIEIFVHERLGKPRRGRIDKMPAEIRFPIIQRRML